jgi:hypothetical protein
LYIEQTVYSIHTSCKPRRDGNENTTVMRNLGIKRKQFNIETDESDDGDNDSKKCFENQYVVLY